MDEQERTNESEPTAEEVEAHLLKETLAAGVAGAAIFAGSAQAAGSPFPPDPSKYAEPAQALADEVRTLATTPAKPVKPNKAKKAKKAAKKVVGRNTNVRPR